MLLSWSRDAKAKVIYGGSAFIEWMFLQANDNGDEVAGRLL